MKKFTSINVEINRSKESEEGRILFSKQNVSSQNMQYEKRRGRYRSGVTYLPSAGSFVRRAVGQ
jgi:ABC-type lipopolysaccharide export system ATPase subunit